MAELPLNEPAGVLIKTTCVDYPGLVAGSFFLKGCNLRCPYCYNTGLVLCNEPEENLNTIQDLFFHLEKRKEVLSGLVISGGEPLLNPYTPLIIRKARELGYKIKIDTNGTLPDKLKELIENPKLKPDFIAMDLKTSPSLYAKLICNRFSKFYCDEKYFEENLNESIKIISELPESSREWRTVLIPTLVTKSEITKMAQMLPKDASWKFAQFQNQNCLDKKYNKLTPYTDSEIEELVKYAKTLISDSVLR